MVGAISVSAGVGRVNLAIAQQHSRNLREVHAMVAAPGIRVVLQHIRRKRAQNRLPSRAISAVVANQRIGPVLRIRPLIGFAGQIDSRNYRQICSSDRARQEASAGFRSATHRPRARLNNALALASAHIQIKPVQSQAHRRACGSSPHRRRARSDLDSARSSA